MIQIEIIYIFFVLIILTISGRSIDIDIAYILHQYFYQ